jgi:hypothetical protein
LAKELSARREGGVDVRGRSGEFEDVEDQFVGEGRRTGGKRWEGVDGGSEGDGGDQHALHGVCDANDVV